MLMTLEKIKKYTLSDFDYNLPNELIAQYPTKGRRDTSRLLTMSTSPVDLPSYDKKLGDVHLRESSFASIIDYLKPGDLLIFNNSKVINSKMILQKDDKEININLAEDLGSNKWMAFAKPAKRLESGDRFKIGENVVSIDKSLGDGQFEIHFETKNVFDFLSQYGSIPIPPYIRKGHAENIDNERYQTIYAKNPGSVAAPTAGLHFTPELLDTLKAKGIGIEYVTLHVGAGTFLPVKVENIAEHKMHKERCYIDEAVVSSIKKTKSQGGRVFAVGTTSMRTVETAALSGGIEAGSYNTDLFVTPGFEFKVIDGLITNFHLPKSTLLMLVSAFAGFEEIKTLYSHAIENKFRFFSYGDATLIFRNKL